MDDKNYKRAYRRLTVMDTLYSNEVLKVEWDMSAGDWPEWATKGTGEGLMYKYLLNELKLQIEDRKLHSFCLNISRSLYGDKYARVTDYNRHIKQDKQGIELFMA